jgi:hypothetical protein
MPFTCHKNAAATHYTNPPLQSTNRSQMHSALRARTSQLVQPPPNVLERALAADVVHDQRPDGAAVVGRRHRAEPLLPRRVPDLCLDLLAVNLHALRLELHPDGGLGVEVEFVPRVPGQQIGLAHGRVPDQHHLEQIVLALVIVVRHPADPPPSPRAL